MWTLIFILFNLNTIATYINILLDSTILQSMSSVSASITLVILLPIGWSLSFTVLRQMSKFLADETHIPDLWFVSWRSFIHYIIGNSFFLSCSLSFHHDTIIFHAKPLGISPKTMPSRPGLSVTFPVNKLYIDE